MIKPNSPKDMELKSPKSLIYGVLEVVTQLKHIQFLLFFTENGLTKVRINLS